MSSDTEYSIEIYKDQYSNSMPSMQKMRNNERRYTQKGNEVKGKGHDRAGLCTVNLKKDKREEGKQNTQSTWKLGKREPITNLGKSEKLYHPEDLSKTDGKKKATNL